MLTNLGAMLIMEAETLRRCAPTFKIMLMAKFRLPAYPSILRCRVPFFLHVFVFVLLCFYVCFSRTFSPFFVLMLSRIQNRLFDSLISRTQSVNVKRDVFCLTKNEHLFIIDL